MDALSLFSIPPSMVQESNDPPASGTRVYRCGPRTRWILLGIWLFILAAPAFMIVAGILDDDAASVQGGLAVAVLESAIVVPIFWLAAWHFPRLVLTDAGVSLQQLGFRLDTSWDNVNGIHYWKRPGLVLEQPLQSKGARRLSTSARFGSFDATEFSLIYEQRYIPLGPFAHWFRHGDLGEQIAARLHANAPRPHAEAGQQTDQPPIPPTRTSRKVSARRVAMLVGIIVALLSLGVYTSMAAPTFQRVITAVIELIVCFSSATYSVANLVFAFRCFRRKQIVFGILWFCLGVVMVFTALAALGFLIDSVSGTSTD